MSLDKKKLFNISINIHSSFEPKEWQQPEFVVDWGSVEEKYFQIFLIVENWIALKQLIET